MTGARWRPGHVRALPARAAAGLICLCVVFASIAVGIGIAGIVGVEAATRSAARISSDEVATAAVTARASQSVDAAYSTAQRLAVPLSAAERDQQATSLFDRTLPQADADITTLVASHAGDAAAERAGIADLTEQWARLRTLLRSADVSTVPPVLLGSRLAIAFAPLTAHFDRLTAREGVDAQAGRRQATSVMHTTIWVIAIAIAVALLGAAGVAWLGIRRVGLALRPEAEQIEFAETMQLAGDEQEAHQLLKRHLERAVPDSTVTVLNRNNSADRLEAVTPLTADSCLGQTLGHAQPRACLAVRSGRVHHQQSGKPALLDCSVCGDCPGSSSCTPLTVGGEVIGSVLVNPPYPPTAEQSQRIHTSVAQAAPILANLRNLAIAEVRAATDALTGLPNKRAVTDTLKRMLAQASRTLTPFALVLIDLDHFKDINDRLGHPVGDQALASVASVLNASIRDSDFAGRNGGEEFAVMLPGTDLHGALQTAEKIRIAIATIGLPDGVNVTASLGVAVYPEHATNTDKLEKLADAALYVAKRSGRNRTELAIPGTVSTQPAPLQSDSAPIPSPSSSTD
jgi:diguanylate cyclase (GGDEF)-like protein